MSTPITISNHKPVTGQKQCRYLKPTGVRCRHIATRGHFYCYHHDRHARPQRAKTVRTETTPAKTPPIDLPLLEDRPTVLIAVTDIGRAILTGDIDHSTSGRLLWAMQIALSAMPRPAKDVPVEEPVDETVLEDGIEMAPESRYWGPNGKPEPRWDLSRWMYVSSKKKKMVQDVTPQEVAETEFPEEGWMTDDELEHPKVLTEKLQRWREEDKREAERLKQQGTGLSMQTRGLDIQAVAEISSRCRKMRVPHVSQRHGMHINHSTDLGGLFKPSFGLSGAGAELSLAHALGPVVGPGIFGSTQRTQRHPQT